MANLVVSERRDPVIRHRIRVSIVYAAPVHYRRSANQTRVLFTALALEALTRYTQSLSVLHTHTHTQPSTSSIDLATHFNYHRSLIADYGSAR